MVTAGAVAPHAHGRTDRQRAFQQTSILILRQNNVVLPDLRSCCYITVYHSEEMFRRVSFTFEGFMFCIFGVLCLAHLCLLCLAFVWFAHYVRKCLYGICDPPPPKECDPSDDKQTTPAPAGPVPW